MKTATKNAPRKKAARKTKSAGALGEFNAGEVLSALNGFAEQLKSGAARDLRTTTIKLPAPLPPRSAAEVRAVREKLRASQAVFAALLNVPLQTVKSWENNQRKPSGAALKLLHLAMTLPPEIFVGT
jgi:putative transcriptional regulator